MTRRAMQALAIVMCAGCATVQQSTPSASGIVQASAASLNGSWAVDNTNADGAVRKTYVTLDQQGRQISGSIRTTQFYYRITDGSGGPESFRLVGSMMAMPGIFLQVT